MSDEPDLAKEEREAIARISHSADGRLLHRYLRRVLETVIDIQDDGTLRTHHGRRTLARDLMTLMAEGIEGQRGRDSDRGDEPIIRNTGTAVARAGSRAERRRTQWAAERDTSGTDAA